MSNFKEHLVLFFIISFFKENVQILTFDFAEDRGYIIYIFK